MRDAVIVEAVRTPIGKRKGSLADIHAAQQEFARGEHTGKIVVLP